VVFQQQGLDSQGGICPHNPGPHISHKGCRKKRSAVKYFVEPFLLYDAEIRQQFSNVAYSQSWKKRITKAQDKNDDIIVSTQDE